MSIRNLLARLSQREIERPVFILGCGRSGTTIFGTALSHHRSITYLNERRDLWFDAYPQTDVWTADAVARQGRMHLTADDADRRRSRRLRRLFYRETVRCARPFLVEKLPINNFRAEFIQAIFPDARFIHIHRNGLEVARSIQKMSEEGRWFGAGDYKWQQLADYAGRRPQTAPLPALCEDFYHKGLLEWRLSTESAVGFLGTLAPGRYLEISYARLLEEPVATLRRVLDFLGVGDDAEVFEFVGASLSRRTPRLDERPPTELEAQLGGRLLPLSMNGATGLCGA